MTKYLVHVHPTAAKAVISLDGFGPAPSEPLTEVGSFDLDIDKNDAQTAEPINVNGEHVFIVEARKVLEDYFGKGTDTRHFKFEDRATNTVPAADENADYSTDALRRTDGGGDPDTSTQPGGIHNTATDENHPAEQEQGNETETPPATDAMTNGNQSETSPEQTGNGIGTGSDESSSSSEAEGTETVAQLKERIAKITDKAELEAIYKAEQEGAKRSTALAAIEARAAELNAE